METSFEIAQAQAMDLAQVLAWARETRAEHAARLPVYFPPEGWDAQEAILTEAVSAGLVLVARSGGVLLGYACWSAPKVEGGQVSTSILDYCVRPDRRGQGIGRTLLQAIAAEKRKQGWHRVTAAVWWGNPASMACFAGAGFDPEFTLWRLGDLPPKASAQSPRLLDHPLAKTLLTALAVVGAIALTFILLSALQRG